MTKATSTHRRGRLALVAFAALGLLLVPIGEAEAHHAIAEPDLRCKLSLAEDSDHNNVPTIRHGKAEFACYFPGTSVFSGTIQRIQFFVYTQSGGMKLFYELREYSGPSWSGGFVPTDFAGMSVTDVTVVESMANGQISGSFGYDVPSGTSHRVLAADYGRNDLGPYSYMWIGKVKVISDNCCGSSAEAVPEGSTDLAAAPDTDPLVLLYDEPGGFRYDDLTDEVPEFPVHFVPGSVDANTYGNCALQELIVTRDDEEDFELNLGLEAGTATTWSVTFFEGDAGIDQIIAEPNDGSSDVILNRPATGWDWPASLHVTFAHGGEDLSPVIVCVDTDGGQRRYAVATFGNGGLQEPEDSVGGAAGNCFSSGGIGINPKSWVPALGRVGQCLLSWAFVPHNVDEYADDLADSFDSTFLASATEMVTEVAGAVPAFTDAAESSDCEGITLTIQGVEAQPINACEGPAATWATFVRTMLTLGILVSGAFTLVGLLMGVWGGPTLNSSSSDGNGQGRMVL